LYWRCFALVVYALFGITVIYAIVMNIIIIISRVIIVIIIIIIITIIKVSEMLVLMRDGSIVSTVSIF